MATGPVRLALFALIVGSVAVGLFIGYQAYRGFRRHESPAMRLLSIGLILLTAVAPSIAFASFLGIEYGYLPERVGSPIAIGYRSFQFIGLCLIAYSLYQRPS